MPSATDFDNSKTAQINYNNNSELSGAWIMFNLYISPRIRIPQSGPFDINRMVYSQNWYYCQYQLKSQIETPISYTHYVRFDIAI